MKFSEIKTGDLFIFAGVIFCKGDEKSALNMQTMKNQKFKPDQKVTEA